MTDPTCEICAGKHPEFCKCKEYDKVTYKPPDAEFWEKYRKWAENGYRKPEEEHD